MEFSSLSAAVQLELEEILHYWSSQTIDETAGGFVGCIDADNQVVPGAPKGTVLTARICWTFAAAYPLTQSALHYDLAERAFNFLIEKCKDPEHCGFYWSVAASGAPLQNKKQIYAQAFTVYAFSQWYTCCGEAKVLEEAISLYRLIRQKAYDPLHGGYWEAFARDWSVLSDLRLSEKDQNDAKTMNTHLHVLEAFATLYAVWPDPDLAADIRALLDLFDKRIIHQGNGHLQLFFTPEWRARSRIISYGHDIEAGWLLLEAATIIGDAILVARFRELAIRLTDAALEGMDADGGLWYERDPAGGGLIKEKHWWPQAEALVGLFTAWQISGDTVYLQQLEKTWEFIQQSMKDKVHGEWYWGITASGRPMANQDKVGLWKCPYHNGRACIELLSRIKATGLHD